MDVPFIWNDGGRAITGFVGLAGDCVVRAIAIATGQAYRDVYEALGKKAQKSPRDGVYIEFVGEYLATLGWQMTLGQNAAFHSFSFPRGACVFYLKAQCGRENSGHLCAVVDGTIQDTWNPAEDDDYLVQAYWIPPEGSAGSVSRNPVSVQLHENSTQKEFEKILNRLRALDRTANNKGSTDGEKRNAIRMIQSLMLEHNLKREDLEHRDTSDAPGFARIACPVNGRRSTAWEKSLAFYMTQEVFPMVQWYSGRQRHRSFFWFYGPVNDVMNAIELFRELVTTIAAAAQLKYRSYVRGSGASYAEGYVAGLPRQFSESDKQSTDGQSTALAEQNRKLIHEKMLSVHRSAKRWLKLECNIALTSGSSGSRSQHDPAAESAGRQDGAKHEIDRPNPTRKITQR